MIDFEPTARIITERELQEKFEEILADLKEHGETALISRHGKVMARLVPIVDDRPLLSEALGLLMQREGEARAAS